MITTHAVYNLNPSKFFKNVIGFFFKKFLIKRKILIEDIRAMSISTESSEFVIHVPSEYDYRFSQV